MNREQYKNFLEKCVEQPGQVQYPFYLLRDTQQNSFVLMKQVSCNDQRQYKDMHQTLARHKQLQNQHLLALLNYHCKNKKQIYTFYQYSSHNLAQQIESRIQEDRQFSDQQLENIIVSVLKALSYLQDSQIGHGCISPFDICLSSGIIKIVDPTIASSSPLQKSQGYYYSPELFENLNEMAYEDIDIFKSDIFSLGMCILHCGLRQSLEDIYDYQQQILDYQLLEDKINKFNQLYSERTASILAMMLITNHQQRPDIGSLFQFIEKQFEQQEQVYDSFEQHSENLNLNSFSYGSYMQKSNKSQIPFEKLSQMLTSRNQYKPIENPIQRSIESSHSFTNQNSNPINFDIFKKSQGPKSNGLKITQKPKFEHVLGFNKQKKAF